MLSITQISGGGDYAEYITKESVGRWDGRAALRMGLVGEVTLEALKAICEGVKPITGGKLTLRMEKDRVAGMDWTFSAPKSASIMALMADDDRITRAFEESVGETMREAEKEIKATVRRFGQVGDRNTGEMLMAGFTHTRTRYDKQNEICDPQLHRHVFVANCTYDGHEKKWKAAKQFYLKKEAPAWQADFQMRFADKLADMGYGIRKTEYAFEIAGVSEELIQKYSRATERIEAYAEEHQITSPKQKALIGPKTRGKKSQATLEDLLQEWKGRLTPAESQELVSLKESAQEGRKQPLEEIKLPDVKLAWQRKRDALTAKRLPVEAISYKQLAASVMKDFYGKAKPEQVHEAIQASGMRMKSVKGVMMVSKPRPRLADRVRRSISEKIRQSRVQVQTMVQERKIRW